MRVADLPAHLRAQARAALDAARPGRPRPATPRSPAGPAPDLFPALCVAYGLPEPVAEYQFDPGRKWRADYAWPAQRVVLEVEGWGHRTRRRFTADIPKYNRLAALGWRLVRCTPATRDTDATLAAIRAALTPEHP